MKVLQKKILTLVLSSILISALVVIGIAFFRFEQILEDNSGQIMTLMCSEKRQSIDEKLLNIEQSVHTIYHYATEQMNEVGNMWADEEQFLEHIHRMQELMRTTAKYTDGAVSVYYRITPATQENLLGTWLIQDENGEFLEQEITNISLYDKDDVEHVGWYYIPIENGKETWINPYDNKNMGKEIISYVIPIFYEGESVGVVGMDIDTELLYENTKAVTVFDTGYAFLMDNEGNFVYHPEMQTTEITADFNSRHAYLYEKSMISAEKQSVEPYQWNNIDKRMSAQKLRNGMIFTVCVTEQEIKQPQQKMLISSVAVIMLIMSVFVAVTVSVTKAIVRLIYTDVMTHVGNKTAYTECVDALDARIREKKECNFTVTVVDINDLKKVNDRYGHTYGDALIQNGADVLKNVWGSDFVYRVGGDEFVVVCANMEKEAAQKKIVLFEKAIEDYNCQNKQKELCLQMAIGMAIYDPKMDKDYMDVFHRADNAMYEDKKEKKMKHSIG